MSKDEQTLDYAPVAQNARQVFTPATFAVFGIGFYLLVFVVLPAGADVKSDWWMRVWFTLLAVGPPYALLILAWAFLEARRKRKLISVLPSVVATILMMAVWFSLFSGYVQTKRDIEAVRARFMKQIQQQTGGQP